VFPASLAANAVRLFTLLACLALVACASVSHPAPAKHAALHFHDTQWRAAAEDSIGLLIKHKFKRDRHPLQLDTNPSQRLASQALAYLGIRYRLGGKSPDSGFDCSGLVTYSAMHAMGLRLPSNTAEIARSGVSVKKQALQAGDLVFFNTRGRRFSHVGIYLGQGQFVHAPRSGGVVRTENMNNTYWSKRYNGARRIEDKLNAAAHATNT
jgi:hypothetical protein